MPELNSQEGSTTGGAGSSSTSRYFLLLSAEREWKVAIAVWGSLNAIVILCDVEPLRCPGFLVRRLADSAGDEEEDALTMDAVVVVAGGERRRGGWNVRVEGMSDLACAGCRYRLL